jgi:hypothetical protein
MKTMRKNKSAFQQPNMDISKNDIAKVDKLYGNFYEGARRQVKTDIKKFSTFSMLKNQFSKKKEEASDSLILEVIKRMERDKLQANIAINMAEKCQGQAQNIQKSSLIKMIPFLIASLGIIVCISLALSTRPLNFSNQSLIMYLAPLALFIPLFFWGSMKRLDAKIDMLTINVLMQAASAYSSAKMQGKGAIAAMQNLGEMRSRSKKIEEKNKQAKKK